MEWLSLTNILLLLILIAIVYQGGEITGRQDGIYKVLGGIKLELEHKRKKI